MRSMILMSVILLTAVTGCAFGSKARDRALLPMIRFAAAGVEKDARSGVLYMPMEQQVPAAVAITAFFQGIYSDPIPESILADWQPISLYCAKGVNGRKLAGEIGTNVAESLTERQTQFALALARYMRGK